MKMSPVKLFVIAGSVALAATAYAGDEYEAAHGSGQAELKMMDTDHDGSVSASEHAAGAKKMFAMMDKDGDGIVTAQEMAAAHKDMPTAHEDASTGRHPAESGRLPQTDSSARTSDASGKPMKPMDHDKSAAAKIKMIDTDQDGTISAAEHEAGARKMFDKMDKDHNGKLSAAEIQAGHDQMMRTAGDE
jgi:Ca2+-binding EF-hand superfamily protein